MYNVKEAVQPSMTKETVEDVNKYPIRAIEDRGLTKETCQHFGVRVSLSEEDGKTITAIYYPYTRKGNIVGYKKKDLTQPKGSKYHFTTIGVVKADCELFGTNVGATGGKKIFITEGENDALAAYQVLKKKYPSGSPTVLSIGLGTANAAKHIGNNLDYLSKFSEVIIAFDQDQATEEEKKKGIKKGREAVGDVALLKPDVLVATFSEKDANDCVLNGKEDELYWALVSKAAPFKPEGFVTVDDVWEEATALPEWGKDWPWPTLTKLTYGRRLGEGVYFGAGVKIGKSEAVNQIAHHVTQVEKGKIALFKLEEKPSMTVRKVAGKIMHKQFHVPDGDFTQEELIEGVDKVREGVLLYDSYGQTSWDQLKQAIRHAVVVEGCKDIVIDPLTRLTTGMNASDANTELERVADEISKMAKDLGFFYMFFCHLKAPQNGPPHEAGGKVYSSQFTGSRAMMRACYYMIGIERDKTLEDEVERNTSHFVLLEDRAFGNTGRFPVFYDKRTGDYLEPNNKEVEF